MMRTRSMHAPVSAAAKAAAQRDMKEASAAKAAAQLRALQPVLSLSGNADASAATRPFLTSSSFNTRSGVPIATHHRRYMDYCLMKGLGAASEEEAKAALRHIRPAPTMWVDVDYAALRGVPVDGSPAPVSAAETADPAPDAAEKSPAENSPEGSTMTSDDDAVAAAAAAAAAKRASVSTPAAAAGGVTGVVTGGDVGQEWALKCQCVLPPVPRPIGITGAVRPTVAGSAFVSRTRSMLPIAALPRSMWPVLPQDRTTLPRDAMTGQFFTSDQISSQLLEVNRMNGWKNPFWLPPSHPELIGGFLRIVDDLQAAATLQGAAPTVAVHTALVFPASQMLLTEAQKADMLHPLWLNKSTRKPGMNAITGVVSCPQNTFLCGAENVLPEDDSTVTAAALDTAGSAPTAPEFPASKPDVEFLMTDAAFQNGWVTLDQCVTLGIPLIRAEVSHDVELATELAAFDALWAAGSNSSSSSSSGETSSPSPSLYPTYKTGKFVDTHEAELYSAQQLEKPGRLMLIKELGIPAGFEGDLGEFAGDDEEDSLFKTL